jgi:hypothetical protein
VYSTVLYQGIPVPSIGNAWYRIRDARQKIALLQQNLARMVSGLADQVASASGSGHGGCPEGIPVELGLLSILAAFGVAFGILYRALTLKAGRRRKRSDFSEPESRCAVDSVGEFLGCRVGELVSTAGAGAWGPVVDILWHGELSRVRSCPFCPLTSLTP